MLGPQFGSKFKKLVFTIFIYFMLFFFPLLVGCVKPHRRASLTLLAKKQRGCPYRHSPAPGSTDALSSPVLQALIGLSPRPKHGITLQLLRHSQCSATRHLPRCHPSIHTAHTELFTACRGPNFCPRRSRGLVANSPDSLCILAKITLSDHQKI